MEGARLVDRTHTQSRLSNNDRAKKNIGHKKSSIQSFEIVTEVKKCWRD